ncbi:glycosyltransferase [Flavobacterium okayamense]|uniref:Glycosyl transferase n=1 Tax=Flavobacterium okayamense TaxID=2830782 RepID=A0ABM7S0Q3_9FLAO|nr:glycosyltransferase [Flavobacterium okayamense]BCY27233.1 glycosyl transferase [Flavobacterium okayamense]
MKLVVVSSAPIVVLNGKKYMYGPYQKEMKIWAKYTDEIQFCCPIWREDKGLLIDEISFPISNTIELKEFNIKSITNIPLAIYYSIINFFIILKTVHSADHLHLRCPGNMALLACIAQIFYPKKTKTAKYAGNWDPKSSQPWSYRIQKWILSNTFLTKNMQVLVYGEWPNQTKNIKPFFTATYSESDNKEVESRDLSKRIRFLFVGMLSEGKQPLYVTQIIKQLILKGFDVQLDYFGDGKMREEVERFCSENDLKGKVFLQGNQPKDKVEVAYQESHFLLLPSKSEGWPKVVAEAMFWGCVPVVTSVSCVPYMLDYGKRGILLTNDIEKDVNSIVSIMNDSVMFTKMSNEAQSWSRKFTTDQFETEISKLLK